MLHLIFQLPVHSAVIERIESADDVVCLENAVFQLIKQNNVSETFLDMQRKNITLNILSEDLESRGIQVEELVAGVQIMNYSGLVKLTEKNQHIRTWN